MSRSKPKDPFFPGMPPIARLQRPWVLTEKIDGTNGLIAISNNLANAEAELRWPLPLHIQEPADPVEGQRVGIWAGSKNQWLGPDGDNFGFGAWVKANADALIAALGEGLHRGEWWGSGIQTGYGLPKGEKRFSLFNTSRWTNPGAYVAGESSPDAVILDEAAIPGLSVVPLLETCDGHALNRRVSTWLDILEAQGSIAALGFDRPEGVVAFQPASQVAFKATIKNDEIPKSLVRRG